MEHFTSIKKGSLEFLGILFLGLFVFSAPVLAAGDPASITINVQPASTASVDSVLSQQPVLLVQDTDSNPVPGVTVTAFKASGTGVLSGTLTATTDSNGLASFQGLRYNKTDSFSISFIYNGGSPITSDPLQLSPGAVSPAKSSISVSPSGVLADGKATAIITVYCKDKYGNVIPGAKVDLSSSGTGDTFTQTDSAGDPGKITVSLSSTKAESKIISVVANGVSIGKTDSINFVPGAIAKLFLSADTPVNIGQTSKIIITALDKFDNVSTNDSFTSVSLSVDNGGSLSSALVGLSDGVASSSLSKTSPGTVNLTASSGSVNAATQIVFVFSNSTAPTVLSQYPANNATDVAVSIMPYVEFSKVIDITTLTTDNVQLRSSLDDSMVPTEVLAANGGKRVILQPLLDLDFNTKYYLYVSSAVADMSGNTLASQYAGGPFTTVAEKKGSTVAQSQSNGQESQNTATVSSAGPSTDVSTSNPPEAQQSYPKDAPSNVTQNDAPEKVADSTSASADAATTVKDVATPTGSVKNTGEGMDAYFQAGLMGFLKNVDVRAFGDWFVSNFILIISIVIIGVVVYISWAVYTRNREE